MVLSELTNKELKGILRENNVRNYSKLNKKGLLKKVNQLIKEQNGGKDGKGKNGKKKKYTLKDFIGGGETPADPAVPAGAPAGAPAPSADPPAGAPAGVNYSIPDSNGTGTVNYSILNANAKGDAVPAPTNGVPTAPPANAHPAPAAQVNSTGAVAPESNTTATQKSKNNALYVYGAKKNGKKNSNGAPSLAYPSNKTPSEANVSGPNNSANNKDACGLCSIQ
jgi:hypothetical protein